jgi:hypothetical protein
MQAPASTSGTTGRRWHKRSPPPRRLENDGNLGRCAARLSSKSGRRIIASKQTRCQPRYRAPSRPNCPPQWTPPPGNESIQQTQSFLICIGENSHASARTDDDQSQDSLADRGDRDARHGGPAIGCRLQLCTHSDDDSDRPEYRRAVSGRHVGGFGEGKGVLTYRGKKYLFRFIGKIIGPGSVSTIDASGEVYKLNSISEFSGPYAQSTGAAGLETSDAGDRWLQNKAGVIMHLAGTQSGVTLSLGRDKILIKVIQ